MGTQSRIRENRKSQRLSLACHALVTQYVAAVTLIVCTEYRFKDHSRTWLPVEEAAGASDWQEPGLDWKSPQRSSILLWFSLGRALSCCWELVERGVIVSSLTSQLPVRAQRSFTQRAWH